MARTMEGDISMPRTSLDLLVDCGSVCSAITIRRSKTSWTWAHVLGHLVVNGMHKATTVETSHTTETSSTVYNILIEYRRYPARNEQ